MEQKIVLRRLNRRKSKNLRMYIEQFREITRVRISDLEFALLLSLSSDSRIGADDVALQNHLYLARQRPTPFVNPGQNSGKEKEKGRTSEKSRTYTREERDGERERGKGRERKRTLYALGHRPRILGSISPP